MHQKIWQSRKKEFPFEVWCRRHLNAKNLAVSLKNCIQIKIHSETCGVLLLSLFLSLFLSLSLSLSFSLTLLFPLPIKWIIVFEKVCVDFLYFTIMSWAVPVSSLAEDVCHETSLAVCLAYIEQRNYINKDGLLLGPVTISFETHLNFM